MRRNVCGGSAVADPHRPQQHHPTVVLKLAQSMMHSLLAYLLLTLPLGTVQEPDHGCRFPDFLQTDERGNGDDDVWRRRDWRTHLRHALSSDDGVGQQDSGSGVSSAVVVVDGPVMRSAAETYRGLFDGDMSFWNSVRDEATGRNRRDGHRTRRRSHRSRFTYVRECVATVSTGSNVQRFLVEHRTPQDAESSYMCVEFVARSESFVQIRESPIISIPNATLCLDDHLLSWNPWPLVDVSRFFSSSGRCPITGGYNIRLYDRKRQLGLCDAYDGETRLESECGGSLSAAAGGSSSNNRAANNSIGTDGMVFRFRYDSCVPTDLGMRTEQRTFCAVSWTIEDNAGGGRTTFIVLRHDSLERAWCFQYTTVDIRRSHSAEGSSQPDHFTALLFAGGLRCDVGQVGTNSTKEEYLKVDLSRDADDLYHRYGQRPVAADYNATLGFPDQLCVDDYEACSYWSEVCESQVASSLMRMTCAKSCGQCVPGQRPAACVGGLPAEYRGVWSEYSNNGNVRIQIADDQFFLGQYRVFRCVRWDTEIPSHQANSTGDSTMDSQSLTSARTRRHAFGNDPSHVWEQMFVAISPGTGCRPRYACIQLKRRSRSVLYYRISQWEIWPPSGFQLNSASEFNCGLFRYRDDVIARGFPLHSKHFKTIVEQDKRIAVDCRLPRTVDFEIQSMTSSAACRGRLALKPQSNDTMILTFDASCHATEKRQEYRCLDSTLDDDEESDWLIVSEWTSSMNTRSTVVCWLFADYHAQRGNAIYRIRAEDCHQGIGSRLASGIVQPEAILVEIDRGDELVIGWHRLVASTTATTMPSTPTTEAYRRTYDSTSHEQTTVQVSRAASDNDDWSFLEDQDVISIYDEPDIVPIENTDGVLSRGRYDITSDDRNVRRQYPVIGSAATTFVSAIGSKPLQMITLVIVGLLMINSS